MSYVGRLLQTSGLPITIRQFWQYSFLYWSFLAMIWYGQTLMVWLLMPDSRFYITKTMYWLIELLFWWTITPIIVHCAQRFPLHRNSRTVLVIRQIIIHFLIASTLYGVQVTLEHILLGQAMAAEQGKIFSIWGTLNLYILNVGTMYGQYMLVVVCYTVLVYVHRYQSLEAEHLQAELVGKQLHTQLANAQLQSLKMQLNPHFLFNTLHTVVSLIIRGQTQRSTLMVTTLSDLLRSVLVKQQANFIPLGEEMTLTRQYLSIQQIRFEDRLTVELAMAPDTEDCLVPQLILQPLVENAITHGVADMTENALIRVTTKRWAGNVIIEVFDNGVGMNHLQNSNGTGLGLTNTLSRLEKAYGDKAQLRLDQPSGGSTCVRLLIPIKSALTNSATSVNDPVHASVQYNHH